MNASQNRIKLEKEQAQKMKKRRQQGDPEVRKRKEAKDKIRLTNKKTDKAENKIKYMKQVEKEIEFDKLCQESKEQNKGPDCFGMAYGNLLHQGVSYETEHSRVFVYAEIYPKALSYVLKLAEPGVTSKYVAPGQNDVAILKEIPEASEESELN